MSSNGRNLQRPVPRHRSAPAYDWNELSDYVRARFSIDLRDCNGKYSRTDMSRAQLDALPHLDFWSWIVNTYNVRNEAYFDLPVKDARHPDFGAPLFVTEIFELLDSEFPEAKGVIHCYFRALPEEITYAQP